MIWGLVAEGVHRSASVPSSRRIMMRDEGTALTPLPAGDAALPMAEGSALVPLIGQR
jgi:hypothetical protein